MSIQNTRIDPELEEQFNEWVQDPDIDVVNDVLWKYVKPSMAERRYERTAILLVLGSAPDVGGMRGRCHVLLVGESGTGKTDLGDWVKYNITEAHGVGPKSSEAGLKGDASGKEFTPGALNLAHGGVLCIEELDKFKKKDRDALYEAMSEGHYDVNQGEIREEYPAEIRAIATANDIGKFAEGILDRFDFVIEVEDYDPDETEEVTDQLYENWFDAFIEGKDASPPPVVPQYLKWVEPFEPGAEEGLRNQVKAMKSYLIHDQSKVGNIREKEAYMRVAYTIAKLNRRDMNGNDFIRAVKLIHRDLDSRAVEKLDKIRNGEPLY